MFIAKKREPSLLEKEIDALLIAMAEVPRDTVDYAKMVDTLAKLHSLKEKPSDRRVSPDTLAIVAGNLAGILMIVGHEKAHVVTSKALSFILKAR